MIETLSNFFTFKSFVAKDIFIFSYYIGAFLFPYLLYKSKSYLVTKLNISYSKTLFILFFLLIELMWRIFCEFFIAYFQIREYLQALI